MKVAYVALLNTEHGIDDARSESSDSDLEDDFKIECSYSDSTEEDSTTENKKAK